MARRALRICSAGGCSQVVPGGRCARHQAQAEAAQLARQRDVNARRPEGNSVYSSERWRKARSEYIRQHPHCCVAGCRGLTRYLDHIRPWRAFPKDQQDAAFWDPLNWQGMCHSCHSKKTASLDGGFGNTRGGP